MSNFFWLLNLKIVMVFDKLGLIEKLIKIFFFLFFFLLILGWVEKVWFGCKSLFKLLRLMVFKFWGFKWWGCFFFYNVKSLLF